MRTLKLLGLFLTTVALVLGAAIAALAQEEAEEGESPYFYGTAEGFLHHDLDNPLDCAIGFTSDSTLTGESTLGALTISQLNCYVPTDTLRNTPDGTITYTFESGDTLTGTIDGDCVPDMVTEPDGVFNCIGTTIVSGGTGALEGATGEIHALGFVENVHDEAVDGVPPDAPYTMVFEGLVEY